MIDATSDDLNDVAIGLRRQIVTARDRLTWVQSDVASYIYTRAVKVPKFNKELSDYVSYATGLGRNAELRPLIQARLGSTVEVADLVAFVSAYNTLATLIENNIDAFIPSLDAQKDLVFDTPLAPAQHNALVTNINDVLALVS